MAIRYTLARKTAHRVLEDAAVHQPPVPIAALVQRAKAVIRFRPFEGDLSGMVHRAADGTAVIGVNAAHSPTRKRFTIAHELGHLLLHADESFHIDERLPIAYRNDESSKAVDPREVEANQFAAELLMPQQFLQRDVAQLGSAALDEVDVETLADRYEVSVQAMQIRLAKLGFAVFG